MRNNDITTFGEAFDNLFNKTFGKDGIFDDDFFRTPVFKNTRKSLSDFWSDVLDKTNTREIKGVFDELSPEDQNTVLDYYNKVIDFSNDWFFWWGAKRKKITSDDLKGVKVHIYMKDTDAKDEKKDDNKDIADKKSDKKDVRNIPVTDGSETDKATSGEFCECDDCKKENSDFTEKWNKYRENLFNKKEQLKNDLKNSVDKMKEAADYCKNNCQKNTQEPKKKDVETKSDFHSINERLLFESNERSEYDRIVDFVYDSVMKKIDNKQYKLFRGSSYSSPKCEVTFSMATADVNVFVENDNLRSEARERLIKRIGCKDIHFDPNLSASDNIKVVIELLSE